VVAEVGRTLLEVAEPFLLFSTVGEAVVVGDDKPRHPLMGGGDEFIIRSLILRYAATGAVRRANEVPRVRNLRGQLADLLVKPVSQCDGFHTRVGQCPGR